MVHQQGRRLFSRNWMHCYVGVWQKAAKEKHRKIWLDSWAAQTTSRLHQKQCLKLVLRITVCAIALKNFNMVKHVFIEHFIIIPRQSNYASCRLNCILDEWSSIHNFKHLFACSNERDWMNCAPTAGIRGHGKNQNYQPSSLFYRWFLTAVLFYTPLQTLRDKVYIKCTCQLICEETFHKNFNELLGYATLFTLNCRIMIHSQSRPGSRGNKEIMKKLSQF